MLVNIFPLILAEIAKGLPEERALNACVTAFAVVSVLLLNATCPFAFSVIKILGL